MSSHCFARRRSSASSDDMEVSKGIRPQRSDWYEALYALALDKLTKPYETQVAGYKSWLFANLKGNVENILEIGVGTGPNLKYYADYPGVNVFGVDPNKKMEKYAQAAAEKAGIKPSNFMFMQGVAEALPLDDASVDAVVGTLVLCSVDDVDQALQEIMRVLKPGGIYIFVEHVAAKDGTILRFVQRILDPLQQAVADGCHLTRNIADNIAKTGFSSLDFDQCCFVYSDGVYHDLSDPPRSLLVLLVQEAPPGAFGRIIKTRDMTVSGGVVLTYRHAFHPECLDQTTPMPHLRESCPKSRNAFLRLRHLSEDAPHKLAGYCFEGAHCTDQVNIRWCREKNFR